MYRLGEVCPDVVSVLGPCHAQYLWWGEQLQSLEALSATAPASRLSKGLMRIFLLFSKRGARTKVFLQGVASGALALQTNRQLQR